MDSRSLIRPALAAIFAGIVCIPTAFAAETESAVARGGRLYDKFWAENKGAKPEADHAAYPHKGGKYGKDASWRCKECHGWDYLSKDGAYGTGNKHFTGITGITLQDHAITESIGPIAERELEQ